MEWTFSFYSCSGGKDFQASSVAEALERCASYYEGGMTELKEILLHDPSIALALNPNLPDTEPENVIDVIDAVFDKNGFVEWEHGREAVPPVQLPPVGQINGW